MKNKLTLQHGKIPPQAVEMEEAVLGALLVDQRAIAEVDFLYNNMFYKEAHQHIHRAIMDLYTDSGRIDLLTVANELKRTEKLDLCGGDFYLAELTQKVSTSAHIETHARIIVQKYIMRSLIASSSEVIENCYDESADVFDLLDESYDNLNNIAESAIKPQEVIFSDVITDVLDRGRKIYNKEIKPGISTPIKLLTERTGGWRRTELIILAARPGTGKTAFALTNALDAVKQNIPTAFFSLEMSKEQLTARILSMEYKIDNQKFNVHGLRPEEQYTIQEGYKKLSKLPLFIDDTASLTIEQLQIKAKRLKSKYGIQFIVIDYLQLMTGKGKNREQEIAKISRGLKKIAKDLDIPVFALSQLSRAVETRGGTKRPLLSDLRESGAIEADADVVMFLYRPEYYGITEWDDERYHRDSTENEAEYIVAKNRNGGLVKNRMNFFGKYTLFADIENDQYNENEFEKDDEPF